MLSTFTVLCNQSPELCSSCKIEILYPLNSPFVPPQPLATTILLSVSMNLTALGKGNQYVSFCDLPHPVPVWSTMLFDKVQTWGICLQRSVSWPGGRGITWDLRVILFFLFNGIYIFTALIIWNLLEMITTLRIDQQLTQTGYNQTNASLVNKSLNV